MPSIRSDETIRKAAIGFFEAAQNARNTKSVDDEINGFGERHSQYGSFYYTEELVLNLNETIKLCTKKLGNNLVHEHDIEETLWKVADEGKTGKEAFNTFCDYLEKDLQENNFVIIPNYQIRFDGGLKEIDIGPAKAILGAELATIINSQNDNQHWSLVVGEKSRFDDRRHFVAINSVCWYVKTQATRSNTRSEAIWLVNVSVSLLRVLWPENASLVHFPTYGQTEPTTGLDPRSDRGTTIRTKTGIRFGSHGVPPHYVITKEVVDALATSSFSSKADTIFSRPAKSLAARVFQGLGWLSRARQSRDTAEKFLYFFTAIEAVLTRDSANSPVTETVSRNAAVILTDKPEKRAKLAAVLKSLYATRSRLVHSGLRDVSPSDTKQLQKIADSVYRRIIHNTELSMSFDKFQADLNHAGYGLVWPPAPQGASD